MTSLTSASGRVIEGDCITVMQTISAASVDFVLTDPPYIARYLDRAGRTVAGDADASWIEPAFAEVYRLLKRDALCASFYGWPHVDTFMAAWRAVGFRPVGHLVWSKRYSSRRRFLEYRHEAAFLLAKGNPAPPERTIGDVLPWRYSGNRRHPTEKSPAILEPLIRTFTRPGQVVLDPFAGSGSTAVAALRLGRRFIAIELEPAYCRIIRGRLWHEQKHLADSAA